MQTHRIVIASKRRWLADLFAEANKVPLDSYTWLSHGKSLRDLEPTDVFVVGDLSLSFYLALSDWSKRNNTRVRYVETFEKVELAC